MGLRTLLLMPGLIVLIAFIVVENATIPTTGQGVNINFNGQGQGQGPPPTTITCTSGKVACLPGGIPNNIIITCANTFGLPCDIQDNCNNIPTGASGLYCAYYLWVIPVGTDLDTGVTVFINNQGQAVQSLAAGASFAFGTFTPQALLIVITVAVGVAALAGITVFGSGESAETVHILFIGGIFLGLWAILSALEGFITGNPLSGFAQINAATGLPIGAGLYLMLTFLYIIGITGTVSRGV